MADSFTAQITVVVYISDNVFGYFYFFFRQVAQSELLEQIFVQRLAYGKGNILFAFCLFTDLPELIVRYIIFAHIVSEREVCLCFVCRYIINSLVVSPFKVVRNLFPLLQCRVILQFVLDAFFQLDGGKFQKPD